MRLIYLQSYLAKHEGYNVNALEIEHILRGNLRMSNSIIKKIKILLKVTI